MYKHGDKLPQNDTLAVKWFRRSAKQGDGDAQYNLGEMFYEGRGVPKDYTQALKWFSRSVEQGYVQGRYWVELLQKRIRANAARTRSSINPTRKIFYKESPSSENLGGASITQRLQALKKLQDAGLISKEEAAAKRKEILKNL
jgi:TPR repeat protein